jgi:hypothetical protein
MGKHRAFLMDALSNLVAFLVFFNLFAFAFAMSNAQPDEHTVWIYLLLAVPFAFMYFLREKVKKMRHFLVIHFAMLVLPFATLSNLWIFGLFMGFAVPTIIYSFYRKGKSEWNMQGRTAVWVIALFAALSLLYAAYFPEMEGKGALLNISSLVSLAAVVLYMHFDNMRFGLGLMGSHHKKSDNISAVSNMLITVFLIIIVIFGALSILFPSEAAAVILVRLLVDIILLPFQFIAWILQSIGGPVESFDELPILGDMFLGSLIDEYWGPEELAVRNRILMYIVGTFAVLVLVGAAVAVLAAIFYRIYRAFGREKEVGKYSLIPEDGIGKLKFVLGDFKELLPRFKLSTKHPVRRVYIKKVNGHIKQGLEVRPHYTPEIIADKIRPKENIDELTQKYEEVRYGRA